MGMVWIDESGFIFADESSVSFPVPLRNLFVHDHLDPILEKRTDRSEKLAAPRVRGMLSPRAQTDNHP